MRNLLPAITIAVAGLALGLSPTISRAQEGDEALRGIVRSANEAMISTDLGFPIEELPFREGQRFAKGDVLAVFDCDGLQAQVQSAEAVLRAEQITLENTARLAKAKAAGSFEVELSRAKTDQAAAELAAYQSKMSRCIIRAPYDGSIAFMRAHAHETPQPNEPLMQIVSEDNPEIEALVPSVWLRWLKPGSRFDINIDETGHTLPAEVSRIGAVVDPVSQTVKIVGRFTGSADGVLPGMSGPAVFQTGPGQ